MNCMLCWTLVLFLLGNATGYNVLMMIAYGSKSHKITFDAVAEELSKRGHQVTIMSSLKTPHDTPGVKNVYLAEIATVLENRNYTFFQAQSGVDFRFLSKLFDLAGRLCTTAFLKEPEVQKLVKNPASANYDVLVVDAILNDWLLVLGPHLKVPAVLLCPSQKFMPTAWAMNLPAPYSYVTSGFHFVLDDMTFYERLQNIVFNAFYIFSMKYMANECDKIVRQVIPDSPTISELISNVSFLLTNSHTSIQPSVPSMPYYEQVGCLHCKKAKPLSEELEDFMRSSGDAGIIYFSLGSATQGSSMPLDMRKKVIEAFASLSQKILWKYETDIEDLPNNIKLTKWAPQQDILAHNKTRLFITHGGGLSIFEAAYHSCPILGFPLSIDQWGNMGTAVGKGFAESLDFRAFTIEEFLGKIKQMLTDTRYQRKVDEVSALLKDRPQDPLETAAYWIEYVVRHKGAPHLKSAAEHLNLFQYFLLDVIALIISAVMAVILIAYFLLRKLYRMYCIRKTGFTKKSQQTNGIKVKKN